VEWRHRAAHAASLVAARDVPNVYCYQSPSSTVEFRPNRFVDITEYMKRKLQAIGVYKARSTAWRLFGTTSS
jgi:LmbE family N-acetylglucosaminyl deacetylase